MQNVLSLNEKCLLVSRIGGWYSGGNARHVEPFECFEHRRTGPGPGLDRVKEVDRVDEDISVCGGLLHLSLTGNYCTPASRGGLCRPGRGCLKAARPRWVSAMWMCFIFDFYYRCTGITGGSIIYCILDFP